MTGTEHYDAAQRLLSRAMRVRSNDDMSPVDPAEAEHCLAAAQVHATLALVAVLREGSDAQHDGPGAAA